MMTRVITVICTRTCNQCAKVVSDEGNPLAHVGWMTISQAVAKEKALAAVQFDICCPECLCDFGKTLLTAQDAANLK